MAVKCLVSQDHTEAIKKTVKLNQKSTRSEIQSNSSLRIQPLNWGKAVMNDGANQVFKKEVTVMLHAFPPINEHNPRGAEAKNGLNG